MTMSGQNAMIRHADGTITKLDVFATASVFGSNVLDRWVIIPPDGCVMRDHDEFVTDLPDGSFDWATPIGDVFRRS